MEVPREAAGYVRSAVPEPPRAKSLGLGHSVSIAVLTTLVFFGGFLGWSAIAELESAATASGVIAGFTQHKTIKHLEGGIVRDIAIREGEMVKSGQLLVRLDDVQPRARLDQLRLAHRGAVALAGRLVAERDGAKAIGYPDWLQAEAGDPRVAGLIDVQNRVFESRNRAFAGKVAILTQQSAQSRQEIEGLKQQIAAETRQLALIDEEIADAEKLLKKGLAEKPRVLALQRRQAEIQGSIGKNRSSIAQVEKSIGETEIKIAELATAQVNEAAEKHQKTEADLHDLTERLRAAEDVLARIEIHAPVDGTVLGLRVHTAGGVAAPGEALMEIVPAGDRLVVDARLSLEDIDAVEPGLPALVRLTGLSYRHAQPLEARVHSVSADSIADPQGGRAYFLARLELDPATLPPGVRLQPGMEVQVMIRTGPRTLLDYLIDPITKSIERAMREQ